MNEARVRIGSAGALFASGFAALIYQSTWAQYLGLIVGHSAYAQSLVLILFMGGMAGGAALTARVIARIKRPILWYVGVELFLAVCGLLYHPGFTAGRAWVLGDLLPWLDAGWMAGSASWVFGASTIILQTIALGATFPLIAEVVITQTRGEKGRIVSTLYFANSIGAGIAALTNVVLVLPAVGLPGSVMTAGLLNALAGLMIWLTFGGYSHIQKVSEKPVEMQNPATAPRSVTRPIYIAAGITGAASFVYEIVWVRILANALGSSMHVFELMLSAFIIGIALGGYVIRKRIDQMQDHARVAGYVQVAMGIFALASCVGFTGLFFSVPHFMESMAQTNGGYWWFSLLTSIFGFFVMLPATICAGMVLPLLTTSLLNHGGGDKSVGHTYAANTFGSIFGVIIGIHVLMPLAGVENAILYAAIADFVLGLYLIGFFSKERKPTRMHRVAAVVCVLGFISVSLVPALQHKVLSSGVYRSGELDPNPKSDMEFYRDGSTASVAALSYPSGTRVIKTNGKPDASITPFSEEPTVDEPTMIVAGALPFAFSENIEDVAVIGFGSGLTSHTVLANNNVKDVDTIEIEPAMVEGARIFGDRVQRVYDDPRSDIIIDDARAYFASSQEKYDTIISEPSNPWVSGVATLFTSEFYSFTKEHLKDGGLLVQWVQLYEISPGLVATIFNALEEEFEDYAVYSANDSDMLVVASPEGKVGKPRFDFDSEKFAFKKEFDRIGINGMDDVMARFAGDKAMLQPFFEQLNTVANSDFFPILSLEAPKTRFKEESSAGIFRLAQTHLPLVEYLASNEDQVGFTGPSGQSVGGALPEARERAYDVYRAVVKNVGVEKLNLKWSSRNKLVEQCPGSAVVEERNFVAAVSELSAIVAENLFDRYGRKLAKETPMFGCSVQDWRSDALLKMMEGLLLERWEDVQNGVEVFRDNNAIASLPRDYLEMAVFAYLVSGKPGKGLELRETYGAERNLPDEYGLLDALLQGHLKRRIRENRLMSGG